MITTVLFDLDGLLIDSEVIYLKMAQEMVRPSGRTLTKEDYLSRFSGRTLDINIRDYIDEFGLPMTVEEGMEWTARREIEIAADGIPLKAGALELIRYLKDNGIRMMLATSSLPDRAERILTKDGVYDLFDGFVFGTEVTHSKPHPETFLLAAKKAGAEPSSCLVLEDSENGIRAAHAGGFPVICVPDLKRPAPEVLRLASFVVDSLDKVIPCISRL